MAAISRAERNWAAGCGNFGGRMSKAGYGITSPGTIQKGSDMTKDDYHARTSNGDIMNDGCADDTRRRVGGRVVKAKQWRADSERRNREPPPTVEQRQQEGQQQMKELLARRANPPSEEEKAEAD